MSFILTYRRPKGGFERPSSPPIDSTQCSDLKPGHQRLLVYEELPDWYRDNHFMRSGYRPVSHSWFLCMTSLGHLHNETLNVYTHLIPAICLIVAVVLVQGAINYSFPEATFLDRAVFTSNITAAVVTMTLSSAYHTLINHSQHVSLLWLRIDYVGILILILGSFFSGIYVGLYDEPTLCLVYWSMIISLSLITSILVLHPRLQGLQYRTHRTWAFIATGLSGFAPIGHGLCLYGWQEMWVRSGMPYYFLEGIGYGIGAFFFITQIPESIWPGYFDIWFSSHQIFHLFVVAASLVHMYGVWQAFSWHYANQHNNFVPGI